MSEQTTIDSPTTTRLPLAHLPAVVLPGATVTLTLATDELRLAVEAAVGQADGRIALTGGDESDLVVVARVPNVGNLPTGESAAIVQVERRARVASVETAPDGLAFVVVEPVIDGLVSPHVEATIRELRATLELIAELRKSRRLPELLRTVESPGQLADSVALWAEFNDDDRLRVLQAVDVSDRVDAIHSWARIHLNELQVAETIRNDVSEGMDKQQREFVLRQQLSAIRKELGEGSDDIVDDYRTRLDEFDAPDGVKAFVGKELDRLERMSEQSPEHGWIRTWLDRIFEMPWGERTADTLDLDAARTILDVDHYGLDDVKERIVEFLAARKLRHERGIVREEGAQRGEGHVLTLVGPPGVGKTSLGESIARSMGRKFVRVALGGVRDEAEIR
ncbi:MAG: LON peptidase substrate-binding domain-containing protein, partial [Ilumatobacter sp.]|nr:LON peptidase substrate-binding domain-containing protein [Ilumatobacter sp.]